MTCRMCSAEGECAAVRTTFFPAGDGGNCVKTNVAVCRECLPGMLTTLLVAGLFGAEPDDPECESLHVSMPGLTPDRFGLHPEMLMRCMRCGGAVPLNGVAPTEPDEFGEHPENGGKPVLEHAGCGGFVHPDPEQWGECAGAAQPA